MGFPALSAASLSLSPAGRLPVKATAASQGMGDETEPVLGREMIDHLERSRRKAGFLQSLQGDFGENPGRRGVPGMGFGDDGIPGGDGGGEIPAGRRVESEGEIVRAENDDGPAQGLMDRTDVRRGVDRGASPRPVPDGAGGLPELVRRAGKLVGTEAGFFGQGGLAMGRFDEFAGPPFDFLGQMLEESGDRFRFAAASSAAAFRPA